MGSNSIAELAALADEELDWTIIMIRSVAAAPPMNAPSLLSPDDAIDTDIIMGDADEEDMIGLPVDQATSVAVVQTALAAVQPPCHLLNCTPEIILIIARYSVEVEENIVVTQVCPGSNKFVHGEFKEVCDPVTGTSRLQSVGARLNFPSIMLSCRLLYNVLNNSAVFYKCNTFEFKSQRQLHSYLSAITAARMKDIMKVVLWQGPPPYPRHVSRAMLSACLNLRQLTVHANIHFELQPSMWSLQVRASTSLEVHVHKLPAEREHERAGLEMQLRRTIMDPYSFPRGMAEPQLTAARSNSNVVIHGSVRLENEVTPFISSRTRGGVARKVTMDSWGVPTRSNPKFSAHGTLLWNIPMMPIYKWALRTPGGIKNPIDGHRHVTDDTTGEDTVEFLVRWDDAQRTGPGADAETSWEPLRVLLTNPDILSVLAQYYMYHSGLGRLDGGRYLLDALRADFISSQDNTETHRNLPRSRYALRCSDLIRQMEWSFMMQERYLGVRY